MTKYLFVSIAFLLLLFSEGCLRQRLTRSVSVPSIASQPSSVDSSIAARPLPADTVVSRPSRPDVEEAGVGVADINFRYLTAKSKISFKSSQQDIDNANVTIRIREDSLIWLSISKLGIEAVRGLITRDSVKIVDKIHHEYSVYDFPALSKQFAFEMNYTLLQALIVGNLPLPKQPAQKLTSAPSYLLLRQNFGKATIENYIGEQDHKLKKLTITEQPTKNTLRLEYEDFTALTNFLFPYSSSVTLDYRSQADGQFHQTLVRIKHNKVELVDKNPGFPITIPASYQRRP